MKAIRQAVTTESLFKTLSKWMAGGSAVGGHTLSVLSAFASAGAVEALEPFIDVFLSKDNQLEAIVGLDLGGTDKHALRRLHSLTAAYHGQAKVWVWDAPQRGSIFHPKLYLLRKSRKVSAVIGSANLTLGGLGSNLESIVALAEIAADSEDARELVSIWETFSQPSPPLKRSFLRELTAELLAELATRLPDKSREEQDSGGPSRGDLWKSLSTVVLPATGKPRTRQPMPPGIRSYLVMDILDETRSTQVQPPAEVMERFFGVPSGADAAIEVSIVTSEGISQPIARHIVKSSYMRRIEIPQIRDLARPCGIVVIRLPKSKNRFAYKLIPQSSKDYSTLDNLLKKKGTTARTRRHLIGVPSDAEWAQVSKLMEQ